MTTEPTADLEKYKAMVATFSVKRILEEARGLGMFYREGKILTAELDAKTQILEDALKPTSEVSVEEIKRRYNQMWDNGEFEWNHHEGDVLGKKPISPERIWNVFILPLLHSHTTALKAKVAERIAEWSTHNAKTITHNNGAREYIDVRELLDFITNIT